MSNSKEKALVPLKDTLHKDKSLFGMGVLAAAGVLAVSFAIALFINLLLGFLLAAFVLSAGYALTKDDSRRIHLWLLSLSYYAYYDPGQSRTYWQRRLAWLPV